MRRPRGAPPVPSRMSHCQELFATYRKAKEPAAAEPAAAEPAAAEPAAAAR